MSILPAVGALFLGIFVGWLTRYFLFRLRSFTIQGLSGVVAVVSGAGVLRLLGTHTEAVWLYPVGLVVGAVVYSVGACLGGAPPEGGIFTIDPTEIDEADEEEDDT